MFVYYYIWVAIDLSDVMEQPKIMPYVVVLTVVILCSYTNTRPSQIVSGLYQMGSGNNADRRVC